MYPSFKGTSLLSLVFGSPCSMKKISDNQADLPLFLVFHERTKHVKVDYHFIEKELSIKWDQLCEIWRPTCWFVYKIFGWCEIHL